MDNARCVVVAGLSGKFGNLIRLSIVNAGLTSLEGFPSLPRLKEVYIIYIINNYYNSDY